jgi:hypothetical protein
MEITGWDRVVFTFEQPRLVFLRVLAAILSRWPAALVQDLDDPKEGYLPAATFPEERLPDGPGFLLFLRDQAMVRHMDDHAYAPMADGDGPFAVIARTRREVDFRISALTELRVTDERESIGNGPRPYPAWLCSPVVFEITLVSPGNPEADPFCIWLLQMVREACGGTGRYRRIASSGEPSTIDAIDTLGEVDD